MLHQLTRHLKVALCILPLLAGSCSRPAAPKQEGERNVRAQEKTNATACPSPAPKAAGDGKLRLLIHNAGWEQIFFEAINKRAKKSGLSDLRASALPDGDLELRVWRGFGLTGLGGFVLRRSSGQWTALSLRPMHDGETQNPTTSYPEPVGGWEGLWNKLVREGLLTLPDSSCFKDYNHSFADGVSYVVEVNMDKFYRAYEYGNPELQLDPVPGLPDLQGPAAIASKQMVRIACLVFDRPCEEDGK
jgi:hypothetical protein